MIIRRLLCIINYAAPNVQHAFYRWILVGRSYEEAQGIGSSHDKVGMCPASSQMLRMKA